MTKRERLFRMLHGEKVDRCPAGFWIHFPENCKYGDAAVNAHLNFVRETDTDILKVMNENIFYDGSSKIRSTSDLHYFRGFTRHDSIMKNQMETIKRIKDASGNEYPILATIHGLLASAFHETGFAGNFTSMGYCLAIFCRERPLEMKQIFQLITESLMEFVDCSLEAGADGIFYAALGGEKRYFTDDEYQEFVFPFEMALYNHIKLKTDFDVLHICKSGIDFNRYTSLKPTLVNWGIHTNGLSLTQGQEFFPGSILLGGFPDRTGILIDGSKEDVYHYTEQILKEMSGKRFILGADCTLPTDIPYEKIRWVMEAVKELSYGNKAMD